MSSTRRTLTELLIIVVLGLLAYGIWQWQESRRNRELSEQAATCEGEIGTLTERAEFWARGLAASEAEAAFRAFLAGVSPALLAGRTESAEQAATQLLSLPGVDFVHILRPDGELIYTSDAKLTATGSGVAPDSWALTVEELTTRAGETRGVTELASPVLGPEGPVAVLWLGYRTDALFEEMRPESLGGSGQ